MAMTTAEVAIFPAGSSVASGSYTEAVPHTSGVGAVVPALASYGGSITYRILNGASAPGVALTIVFYTVRDDNTLVEIDRATGTTNSSTTEVSTGVLPPSGVIPIPMGVSRVTAKAFGNTVNSVGLEVFANRLVP